MEYLALYFGVVSLLGIVITIYDKNAARKRRGRISEKTLLLCAAFGAATAMFVSMQFIRHKTRHNNFLLIMPIFMVLHVALIVAASQIIA